MSNLPNKITHMIEKLHEKGYHDIYLYSGMSPSGLNWRFKIGRIVNNRWPNNEDIVGGSVRVVGDVEWSDDTSTAEVLAEKFESYYKLSTRKINLDGLNYVKWYSVFLKIFKENEAPIFYADYNAPHEYLLENAPGYRARKS